MKITDFGDKVRLSKFGHAHTRPFVRFTKIGVIDRQTLWIPPDSVVLGVAKYLGDLYLKIQVHHKYNETVAPRYFYAFCNAEYMKMPNLLCIDCIVLGGQLWFVFEDDIGAL